MGGLNRFVSAVGERRLVAGLGGLFILLAAIRFALLNDEVSRPLVAILATDLVIGLPGAGLLYGAHQLGDMDLHPDTHQRIVKRCLAGIVAMLGVVGLLAIGGINRPLFTPFATTALGAIAGFGIGLNEARALSRALDAEEHRDLYRAERDLRERLLETSPVGITVVNGDRSIRMVNERVETITGVSQAELLERKYDESMFDATDAEGNPVEEGIFEQVLSEGEPVYDVERQITRSDGERIWLLANGAPLRDPSGDTTGVVFATEDITERKQLERDLKETVDRLEQSNDRLRQFAYAASHDLKEPLRMVSSYLQLLEKRYKDDLDTEAREFIDLAVDGADRMREMVEDLLAFSRVEEANGEFEPVDCGALVEQVLDDLEVKIEESDAEIVTESLPTVEADENQLEQLFQNLISNAIKYSDDEPRIEISAEQQNDLWEFSVTDEGIGIKPERTDRIFEVFKRLHTDDEYSGTGIGLSLCQKIVENHGGDIWVDSESGEGSTFSFTLPRQEPVPQHTASL